MTVLEDRAPTPPAAAHGVGRMIDTVGVPLVVLVENDAGDLVEVDPCLIVDNVTIRHGRASLSTPVSEPASATFRVIAPTVLDPGTLYPLRRRVRIDASPAALAYWSAQAVSPIRFAGRIAEVTAASDPLLGAVLTITAGGPLADLGRVLIGDEPWPQQWALDRVVGVTYLAGLTPLVASVDSHPPGSTMVLARDVDRRTALDLITTYANLGMLYVFDFPSADSLWISQDLELAQHVSDVLALPDPLDGVNVVLDACDLFADWSATWSMAGMVNRLSIGWGPKPPDAEQPRTVFTDDASIATFATMDDSLSTDLVGLVDAQYLADARFAALAAPSPSFPDLRADLWLTVPRSSGAGVLYCNPTSLLGLTNLPPGIPINAAGLVVVNGYTETISPDSWAFTFAVYDPIHSATRKLWNLAPDTASWDSAPADIGWDTVDDWDW